MSCFSMIMDDKMVRQTGNGNSALNAQTRKRIPVTTCMLVFNLESDGVNLSLVQ